MEDRIVDFVAGLRGAGVRVSVAESADCLSAVDHTGVRDRETFRRALHITLIKDGSDLPKFERLFPLYFGTGEKPRLQPSDVLTSQDSMYSGQASSFRDVDVPNSGVRVRASKNLAPEGAGKSHIYSVYA